jgi:DNA polymerase-3 subunit alpha
MAFVHLHQHTEHSLFDGLSRIVDVPKQMAALGMNAGAITDHGSLTGALKFRAAAKEAGIKPIIGMEAYIAIGPRSGRESRTILNDLHAGMGDSDEEADGDGSTKTKVYEHLTILARNEQGWKNLLALHNASTHPDSYWYKPRIDYKLLAEKSEGLIVLTGCLAGPIAGPLSQAALWDQRVLNDEETVRAQAQITDLEIKAQASAHDSSTVKVLLAKISAVEATLNAADRAAECRAEADSNLQMLIAGVGVENVYLEIMLHNIQAEKDVLLAISDLSDKYGVPMVVTNDSHYLLADHAEAHDTFLTAGKKDVRLDTPGRFKFNGSGYWLKSEAEMRAINPGPRWQAACDMTQVIADRIDANVIPDYGMMLPKFPLPDGFAHSGEYLRAECIKGGIAYHGVSTWDEVPANYRDRLDHELTVIHDQGVDDYFLITDDFIKWCKSDAPVKYDDATELRKKPITMGLGRGSAAGALTSFYLKIVGVDPIENNLLFERFLEPGRKGLPDIDIDGEDVRRGEQLAYLQYRWGADRVAQIGSWGMARSKSAIKDAARAMQPSGVHPADWETLTFQRRAEITSDENELRSTLISLGNKLANAMPMKGVAALPFATVLDRSNLVNKDFWAVMDEGGPLAEKILRLAVGMENVAKTPSIHPCGVVISPVPLAEIVPLRRPTYKASESNNLDSLWVICWDGVDVDAYGLLKLDVLGLLNLGLAAKALDYIKEVTGEHLEFEHLPHPDTKGDPRVDKAWALLSSGKTTGLFQLGSAGIMKVAQDVGPSRLTDISAVVALFRPGPLSAGVPALYASRKNGREAVDYNQYTTDPIEQEWIAKILGDTYGLMVFQESLMLLGTVIAGFDAGQRSVLRKAVGKKKPEEMKKVGEMLLAGAEQEFYDADGVMISPSFSKETVVRVYDLMKGSAEYLFNAAHSAAYGYLAYITAFLKANWPVEYSAAVLAVAKPEMRLATLRSLNEEGIVVLAPDVNVSRSDTSPADGKVVIGLKEIRDVGEMGEYIAKERKHGRFESMGDIVGKVLAPRKGADDTARKVSSSALVGLVEAGALDSMDGTRLGKLLASRAAESDPVIPAYDWSPLEQGRRQVNRIGTIVGVHPIRQLNSILKAWEVPDPDGQIPDEKSPDKRHPVATHKISDVDQENFFTAGIFTRWDEGTYSGGTKRRINFTLEGSLSSFDGVIWEKDFDRLKKAGKIPEIGELFAVSGRVNIREIVLGGGSSDDDVEVDEDVVLEKVTVKELTVNDMWLIDAGPRVVKIEEAIPSYSFRSRWETSRPDPDAPKPARKPAAKKAQPETVETAPIPADVVSVLPVIQTEASAPVELMLAAPVDLTEYRERRGNHLSIWLEDDRPDLMAGEILLGGDKETLVRNGRMNIPSSKTNTFGPGSIIRVKKQRLEAIVGINTATPEEATAIAEKIARIQADDAGWVLLPNRHPQQEWHYFDWSRHSLGAVPGDIQVDNETA